MPIAKYISYIKQYIRQYTHPPIYNPIKMAHKENNLDKIHDTDFQRTDIHMFSEFIEFIEHRYLSEANQVNGTYRKPSRQDQKRATHTHL